MKYGITFLVVLIWGVTVNAQATKNGTPVKYEVVVSFGSMCCGTPSDDFLKDYIKKFTCKNKITINAWQLGGCGREGEYKILFSLVNLKETNKTKLIAALKKLIPEQNDKNKAANASSGYINLDYNLPLSSFENCRGQLTPWSFVK
jgi:hypothetical protein